jgi:hypothetical protein
MPPKLWVGVDARCNLVFLLGRQAFLIQTKSHAADSSGNRLQHRKYLSIFNTNVVLNDDPKWTKFASGSQMASALCGVPSTSIQEGCQGGPPGHGQCRNGGSDGPAGRRGSGAPPAGPWPTRSGRWPLPEATASQIHIHPNYTLFFLPTTTG